MPHLIVQAYSWGYGWQCAVTVLRWDLILDGISSFSEKYLLKFIFLLSLTVSLFNIFINEILSFYILLIFISFCSRVLSDQIKTGNVDKLLPNFESYFTNFL